ncbi:MAG: MarR family transcriptional regulator [Bacillota bacterium]|nr:MarR family transcriptional regulator [Bacillota bacterium]
MSCISDVLFLANNIIRSSRIVLNEKLKPLGLSSAEANILLQLLTVGDMVRQEDLVEQLDVSKPAVSRALDALEHKGFVTRERDLSDKRACLVTLTPKAHAAASLLNDTYEQIVRVAEAGLTAEDTAVFLAVFQKVSNNFTLYRTDARKGNQ